MFSHEEMIGLQAEKHELIDTHTIKTKEAFVLNLIHAFAYVQASRLSKNKKVLDLGCNTGYGSEILFKNAKKITGVDVSKNAISFAKSQYGHLGIHFQQIDGKRLPFEDNEFDMVVSCQVIEHIVNHSVFINELKRVLKPGGIVFFTTPNAFIRLYPGMKPWNKFHVREFSHFEFQALLIKYFPAVKIYGLDAKEPLYSIEANRVDKVRKEIRKKSEDSQIVQIQQHSLKTVIKKMIPSSVISALRKITQSSVPSEQAFDSSFISQYGIDDFSYRSDALETALDLTAICSDSKSSLKEVRDRLAC